MKIQSLFPSAIALLFLSTLNAQLSTTFAQGSLTPPGAPAPAMKSLAQIEPRTPISSAPFTITNRGSYYLTTNLNVVAGDAITISANGVTLALNGFTTLNELRRCKSRAERWIKSVSNKISVEIPRAIMPISASFPVKHRNIEMPPYECV